MAQKRQLSPPSTDEPDTDIFISDTIEDRSSTFIAYYSPKLSAKALQATSALKTASHRIAAWRKPSAQKSLGSKQIFSTSSDDDGEKYAGKKVEKVLNELNAVGAVVVARWYGGVLLGPVRFTHIENVAKQAIARSRGDTSEPQSKKPRAEIAHADDTAEKQRIAKQLSDRDRSIVTLRQLLTDKQSSTKEAETNGQTSITTPTTSLVPTPDYLSMPLSRLKQLDKARDATIAWILKQIDAAEEASVKDCKTGG